MSSESQRVAVRLQLPTLALFGIEPSHKHALMAQQKRLHGKTAPESGQ